MNPCRGSRPSMTSCPWYGSKEDGSPAHDGSFSMPSSTIPATGPPKSWRRPCRLGLPTSISRRSIGTSMNSSGWASSFMPTWVMARPHTTWQRMPTVTSSARNVAQHSRHPTSYSGACPRAPRPASALRSIRTTPPSLGAAETAASRHPLADGGIPRHQ